MLDRWAVARLGTTTAGRRLIRALVGAVLGLDPSTALNMIVIPALYLKYGRRPGES